MRILVTGGAGFLGYAVVQLLSDSGHRVTVLDRLLDRFAPSENLKLVEGDLVKASTLDDCFSEIPDAIVHLAAVPGGTAEQDPQLSFDVNVKATLDLFTRASSEIHKPRIVYTSTIAVLGDPLPAEGVNDATQLLPRLNYGMHKVMAETVLGTMSRRGEIDGVGVRLPGIVARPKGPSGMKSAFMSDIFHAINDEQPITLPVSEAATLWLMSVETCAKNIVHAVTLDSSNMPQNRVVTLPAIRTRIDELVDAIKIHCGRKSVKIDFEPDKGLEKAFGSHPNLSTQNALRAGFENDGSLERLVANVVAEI